MSFLDTVARAKTYLREHGRVSLRGLKREFDLDDEALHELVEELVDVQQVAAREGKILSWIGLGTARARPETRERTRIGPEATEDQAVPEAERRQLTVLFCDLVDSTGLAAGMEAEDWREVVRDYQRAAAEVIERFGGHVAQYLGDGLLVYFGWPHAHEDDAERAVRAGLGIVEAVAESNPSLKEKHGVQLAVRLGIHTGPVVVGEMGGGDHRETLAMGDTTNVAARLQGVAEANTLCMSAATLRLVSGIFVTRDLGERELKGVGAIRVHQALRTSGVRSRLDVAAAGLTPFVGRDQELMLLDDRWAQVQENWGQAVLISGEAGIGKSRVVQAFRERLAEQAHTWLECRGSPYTQDSAFYPVLELQRLGLGFRPDDPAATKLERIEAGLEAVSLDLSKAVPLVAALHGVPLDSRYEEPVLSPEGRRRKTIELLSEWLLRLGERQPLVLLMEDLHWMDPSTLELMGQVLDRIASAQVLLLLTHRPDLEPPWGARSHLTPMLLSRLTRIQLGDLVRKAAHGRDLPEAWVEEILRRADGVPLFAEELTRVVLETNPEPPHGEATPELRIPDTLQDSLTARLDALGSVKELAQLGSVLGREFSYGLLLRVSPMRETELRQALVVAVREELFYQRGVPPDATYLFKHALIRDAAYQSLLRATRQRHHRRLAETLIEWLPQVVEAQPELVAHHLTEAGNLDLALPYWERAARSSLERFAHLEAQHHVDRALELVAQIPRAEQAGARLSFELLGAKIAFSCRGYGSVEAGEWLERARTLARETENRDALVDVTHGLWLNHHTRGEREPTVSLASEFQEIVCSSPNPLDHMADSRIRAQTAFFLGNHEEARLHFGRVIEQYEPSMHERLVSRLLEDLGLWCLIYGSLNEWVLGYPDHARRLSKRSLDLARELNDSFGLAGALVFVMILDFYRRDFADTTRTSDETIRASSEQGFAVYEVCGRLGQVVARGAMGETEVAVTQMQALLPEMASTGTQAFGPTILAMIGWLQLRSSRFSEAMVTFEAALAMARTNIDCFSEAELLQLKGEALLGLYREQPERGEALLRESLELAKERRQRMFELRAATSLGRLWQRQGKRNEARDLLQPVYDWFTEGFDTQDLKDAKALLEELS